jgi:hypothetical protein
MKSRRSASWAEATIYYFALSLICYGIWMIGSALVMFEGATRKGILQP